MSLRLPGQMPRVPERVDRWLRRTTFGLLGVLAALLLTHQVFNSDIWWHLKTGLRILDGAGIPQVDPYTYTVAGREWIDMHWGFQVLIALLYRAGGVVGMQVYLYVTIGAALGLTARSQYTRDYWSLTAVFLLVVLLAANTRFLVRPEALTFLFLSAEMFVLSRMRDERWNRWLWIIPPLIIVWANVQGLFVLGVVLVVVATAAEVLRRMLPMPIVWQGPEPLPAAQWQRLRHVTALAVFAGFVTPYGLRGLLFPFTLFTRVGGQENVFAQVIAEFQPPFGAGPLTAPAETFVLFLVLAVAILIAYARYLPLDTLLMALAFGFLALSARRNVPVALLVLTPLVVGSASALIRRAERVTLWDLVGARMWAQAGLALVVCLTVLWHVPRILSDRYYVDDRRGERFGWGFAENIYPGAALDFVLDHDLPGPLFNSMYIGGYAIYRLSPEYLPVALDSRLEVHTAESLGAYVAAARGRQELDGLLNLYGAQTAVITHSSQDAGDLFASLMQLPHWHCVYLDACAAVFVRTPVALARRLSAVSWPLASERVVPVPAGVDTETPGWARALTRGVNQLRVGRRFPTERFNMGTLYLQLGQWGAAVELFEAGLRQYPDTAYGWYNLGLAYEQTRRTIEATRAYERAVALRPRLAGAWVNLGLLARDRRDYGEAQTCFEHAVQADRNNVAARYNLAATLSAAGEYGRAYPHFSHLTRQMPDMGLWWFEFGRTCRRVGRFAEGVRALRRAAALEPHVLPYWLELSDLLFAAGQPEDGTQALRRAYELGPEEPAVRERLRGLGGSAAP